MFHSNEYARRERSAHAGRATRAWKRALLLVVLLSPSLAHAGWQNFKSVAGGLPSNQVAGIAEDRDGRMWFATETGASRYDGTRWTAVTDSLPLPSVLAVHGGRDGSVWFGTAGGGLARELEGRWSRFTLAGGHLPDDYVSALLEDHRGDVWAGTSNGLARRSASTGAWTAYAPQSGGLVSAQVTQLFEDSAHRLWIGTLHGASMLDSTRTTWTSFPPNAAGLDADSVLALCEDAHGRIWFGTNKGAWTWKQGAWRHWLAAEGLPGNFVLSMARDSSGHMWFGGLDGYSRSDGLSFRFERTNSDGQLIGPVRGIVVDASGGVWLASHDYDIFNPYPSHYVSQGAHHYDGVGWWNYFAPETSTVCEAQVSANIPVIRELPSNCGQVGFRDHAGELWFATFESGIARRNTAGAWSRLHRGPGVPLSDSVTAIVEDSAGTLWFGSRAGGLAGLDVTRASWISYRQGAGLPSNDLRTLFVDAAGDLWAGTAAGAARRHAGAWTMYALGGAEVEQFVEESSGRLWLRTLQGLFAISADRASVRRFTAADGLIDDYPTALAVTRDGSVWVGTSAGASRLSGGSWESWPGNSVYSIREDSEGRVWLATGGDASLWDGASWQFFRAPPLPGAPVTDVYFEPNGTVWCATEQTAVGRWNGRSWKRLDSRGNGLTHNQVSRVFSDGFGHMWVICNTGIAEHEPDRTAPQTVFVSTSERVSPSRNVSMVFGAAYGEVADLEYQTSWDGEPWSAWSSENTWQRQGVADGPHTFAVRARDWSGNVDPTPATYRFEIDATPPPAEITSPGFGAPVRGECAVIGSTADPRFRSWVLEARRAGTEPWTSTLGAGTWAISQDTLAIWDTSELADGDWELRLSVLDELGLSGIARARVIVDNVAPFADVTSPVRIVAGAGGHIFTTNTEAHLFFPPNAFDADPIVTVDSLLTATGPDTLLFGFVRGGPVWSLGWTEASLRKEGVLELKPWAPGGSFAVYHRKDGSAWSRTGGTAQQDGALALTVREAGEYALFRETLDVSGDWGPLRVQLTPRAFSPRRSPDANVAIGFSTVNSGRMTVKVYNRAGRLVRRIVEGAAATPGENLVRWDGRDSEGRFAEAGLYLVTVECAGHTVTQTVAVLP